MIFFEKENVRYRLLSYLLMAMFILTSILMCIFIRPQTVYATSDKSSGYWKLKETNVTSQDNDIGEDDEDAYFITHRITQINGEECITQGDNNNLEDSKFNTKNIRGAVVSHSKVLGFFILYLLKPLAIIYLGSLLFVIFSDKYFKDNKELNKEV